MKPSKALYLYRDAVRRVFENSRVRNPRVFGSALRGDDKEGSDLDLLVDALPGTTLFELGGLQVELEELLGVRVDLLTPGDLPPPVRERVLREAITIGEAAARVVNEHAEFANAYPDIPWRQMRGMRNRMAHGYFDINLDIVWETVQSSLPALQRQLQVAHSRLASAD